MTEAHAYGSCMFTRFTDGARQACDIALTEANMMGAHEISSGHLLLGLLQVERVRGGGTYQGLQRHGVDIEQVREAVRSRVRGGGASSGLPFSEEVKRILHEAWQMADAHGETQVDTTHLALAMLRESEYDAAGVLRELSVRAESLVPVKSPLTAPGTSRPAGAPAQQADNKKGQDEPVLERYARELVGLARLGLLDPVVGRERELRAVIETLSRRSKNAPVLIGDPGVGKSALVEGLAHRVAGGQVPQHLLNLRIYSLDLANLLAGTRFRGDLEGRVRAVVREASEDRHAVLFIDEIHAALGTGAAEGGLDVATLLKPALARGELRLIGATTEAEFRRHLQRDPAFERRLHPITVPEPSSEETLAILRGLLPRLQAHHGITFDDQALEAAVEFSQRYLPDRFLPDKAIDLLDHAAARLVVGAAEPQLLSDVQQRIAELERAVAEHRDAGRFIEQVQAESELTDLRCEREMRYSSWLEERRHTTTLGRADVADVIAEWVGLPIGDVSRSEAARYRDLEEALGGQVLGQDDAVGEVARALRRARSGIGDPRRPMGSFLFLGPTGVGKTELARALARELCGSQDALVQLDMSEYMEQHSVAKLIGAPPGYVGHNDGGRLTDALRRRPYSVVVFDEIEKAHPDVSNLLLQVMEEGQLTDARGRVAPFRQAVVIVTSNLGSQEILRGQGVGFGARDEERRVEAMRTRAHDALRHHFRPELLNRFDAITVFSPLSTAVVRQIAQTMIERVCASAAQQNWALKVDESVLELVIEEGTDDQLGARPMRRAVQRRVEDPLADFLLSDEADQDGPRELRLEVRDGMVQVRRAARA